MTRNVIVLPDDSGKPLLDAIAGATKSRELALEVNEPHIIDRLRKTLEHDWENSHALDLSDEGLLSELKNVDENVEEDLALHGGKHHKNK